MTVEPSEGMPLAGTERDDAHAQQRDRRPGHASPIGRLAFNELAFVVDQAPKIRRSGVRKRDRLLST